MNFKPFVFAIGAMAALASGIAVLAQGTPGPQPKAPAATVGNAHLWAEVGSFQLEGGGTVTVKFTGTLLVSKADGQSMPSVTVTGNVRKEFENAKMGRTAWFGTGNATITGSWRHLTVFGKKMDARWRGSGIAQVYGEFDSAGKTGFITVDGSEPFEWMSSGLTFHVPASSDPRIQPGTNPTPPPPGGGPPRPRLSDS